MNIFYGICGEGLGHFGRSIALVERLCCLGHRVTLFTFGDAMQLLTKSGYQPVEIAGLRFGEGVGGGVSLLGTVGNFRRFLCSREPSIDLVRQRALSERCDLVITDFEPITAAAAATLGLPCVSVDSQHRFCEPLSRQFPPRLRLYGRLAGAFVDRWIKAPRLSVVAVFHRCAASRHYQRVEAFQRDRITAVQPSMGEHVVLYGRGELGRRLAQAASGVPQNFIAYGCRSFEASNIEFKAPSGDAFVRDLASAKAVVCAGGQQLIGEARYFGKPLLIVPIPRQHEQEINARYAQLEGIGEYCPLAQLNAERIRTFLSHRYSIPRIENGLDQALKILGIGYG